jgi:predicted RNase H-like nuclease
MNLESLLVYAAVAGAGWLLRHLGIGATTKMPGLPSSVSSHVPLLATLKADIDQIVKAAVEAAVKQAVEDIKNAAAPLSAAR